MKMKWWLCKTCGNKAQITGTKSEEVQEAQAVGGRKYVTTWQLYCEECDKEFEAKTE